MSMDSIAGVIKLAALDAVEADKPVAVLYGQVTAVSPLTVEVEQKLKLSGEQLVAIRGELSVGDSVALLREQGGQRFVVLGVV
ncbi:MAG: DUF2577 domain-containing protein [Oscillospiraceae bacterium]|nr:DUF2577 domain-containing protein [Oscillospiraceae bacterium]